MIQRKCETYSTAYINEVLKDPELPHGATNFVNDYNHVGIPLIRTLEGLIRGKALVLRRMLHKTEIALLLDVLLVVSLPLGDFDLSYTLIGPAFGAR